MSQRDKPRQAAGANRLNSFRNGVSLLANAFGVGFIDGLGFAGASSAPNLIVRVRLMKANTVSTAQLIPAGRINEWRLRLTCAASPGAFGTVQVKELPSSVDHFADGLP